MKIQRGQTAYETEWMDEAKCKGVDTSRFFPTSTSITSNVRRTSKRVMFQVELIRKEFCLHCPVRLQCFDYAVATDAEGIHGGFLFHQWKRDDVIKRARKQITEEIKRGVAA